MRLHDFTDLYGADADLSNTTSRSVSTAASSPAPQAPSHTQQTKCDPCRAPRANLIMTPSSTPPRKSSISRPHTPLSLDLSSLPPLSLPTPPSNTLLITNLQDVEIFRPDNLQTIKDLINASAPIHTWAPLKSFRRIVVSFHTIESATRIRQILDGEAIMGETVRVYFGQHTPNKPRDEHLNLPDAGKLFFISPPPSPPQGWEVRLEDAPNKMVHAEDLAEALAKLHHRPAMTSDFDILATPISASDSATDAQQQHGARQRSSSTTIYDPNEHGNSPGLPAIEVVDLTDDGVSPMEVDEQKPILAHTARPPVELMP